MSDDFPSRLLKFYSAKDYADAFLEEGRIRLYSVKYFREIEDPSRLDRTEGEGRLVIPSDHVATVNIRTGGVTYKPGELQYSVGSLNPTFIFCTSLESAEIAKLCGKWDHCVEIFKPKEFHEDLLQSVQSGASGSEFVDLDYGPVFYTKGGVSGKPLIQESARLPYMQKPPEFEFEKEFRFAVKFNAISFPEDTQFIDVKLAKCASYARVASGIA